MKQSERSFEVILADMSGTETAQMQEADLYDQQEASKQKNKVISNIFSTVAVVLMNNSMTPHFENTNEDGRSSLDFK